MPISKSIWFCCVKILTQVDLPFIDYTIYGITPWPSANSLSEICLPSMPKAQSSGRKQRIPFAVKVWAAIRHVNIRREFPFRALQAKVVVHHVSPVKFSVECFPLLSNAPNQFHCLRKIFCLSMLTANLFSCGNLTVWNLMPKVTSRDL